MTRGRKVFNKWHWYQVKDGDPRAYALMRRHYSFHEYQDNRRHTGQFNERGTAQARSALELSPVCQAHGVILLDTARLGLHTKRCSNELSRQVDRLRVLYTGTGELEVGVAGAQGKEGEAGQQSAA